MTVIDTAPLRKVVQRFGVRQGLDGVELVCGHVVYIGRSNGYHAEKRRCLECQDDMNRILAKMR